MLETRRLHGAGDGVRCRVRCRAVRWVRLGAVACMLGEICALCSLAWLPLVVLFCDVVGWPVPLFPLARSHCAGMTLRWPRTWPPWH